MKLTLMNGYSILNNMTAREPGGNQFCICNICRKKYPFLSDAIKKYEEDGIQFEEDKLAPLHHQH